MHQQVLKNIENLKIISKYGLTVNVDKSVYGAAELEFTRDGLKPLPSRDKVIEEYKLSSTVGDLRRFLGMINFYRRFLPDAAKSKRILHNIYNENEKNWNRVIILSEERKQAFENLNKNWQRLLSYPYENAETSICVDASDYAMVVSAWILF